MKVAPVVFSLGIVATMSATQCMAADTLVQFESGIGVIPASSSVPLDPKDPTATTLFRNIARNVLPPGQLWVIKELRAEVMVGGAIAVDGKGLLQGAGNIRSSATPRVFATLVCEANESFILHNSNTAGVALTPNGDFRMDDILKPPPNDCPTPVLLIRSIAGAWFAAAIPRRPEREPNSSQMRSPFGH